MPTPRVQAANEVLFGVCRDMPFTFTFTNRPATPEIPTAPPTQTLLDVDGDGDCTVYADSAPTGVTKEGTFDATGATLPGADTLLCQGGAVTLPGSFDTEFTGMQPFGGASLIAVAESSALVSLASDDWQGVPAGIGTGVVSFEPLSSLGCAGTVTGEATFSFVAKSSALTP